MKIFKAPKTTLGDLDADAAAGLIASATDIALILDENGMIQDVAIAAEDLLKDLKDHEHWVGARWVDIVTEDSQRKAAQLLSEALSKAPPRWRHLNHPAVSGPELPVLYSAMRTGRPNRVVAFGRNLRAVSSLQRRLVDAQQSMERDYARVRRVETRYRLLFEMTSDAALIVEATSRKVIDSNPAAGRMFAERPGATGKRIGQLFTAETAGSVEALLAGVHASGRSDDVRARLAEGEREVAVSASLFQDDGGVFCLVRVISLEADAAATPVSKARSKLLKLMEGSPDGFVVTGADGGIVTANAAFIQLVQLPNEERARGEKLDRWLGRTGVDLTILIANLRQHGSVRLFGTTLRGELGEPSNVEVSAVTVMNGGQPCFGFAIRDVSRRLPRDTAGDGRPPSSLDHLTGLIGRVALKDLVREATDVIERLCIEGALELTSDNRASAAEMLGLSRQSLYIKLRRYGMAPMAPEGGDRADGA